MLDLFCCFRTATYVAVGYRGHVPLWTYLSPFARFLEFEVLGTALRNPLALKMDIYSLAHHLYKMLIFYEPRMVTLGNTRNFVEE